MRNSRDISRRVFLRQVAAGGVSLLAAASIISLSTLTGNRREEEGHGTEFSKKLREWRFPNGQLASDLFPELLDYSKLLDASSLPFLRSSSPLQVYYFDNNDEAGMMSLRPKFRFDPEEYKDLRIEVATANDKGFSLPMVVETNPRIGLTKRIRGTNAELVVLSKEVSQVEDYAKYCRRYRQALEETGTRFRLVDNKGVFPDQDYMDLSIGLTHQAVELKQTGRSWLQDFIDEGSFLRIGAILYANWAKHFPDEVPYMPKAYTQYGERWVRPLIRDGIITLQGDFFRWSRSQPPDVFSNEFYLLWGTYGSWKQS